MAQIHWGELSGSSNGTIASGYTADYGNMTGSDHGWTVGGDATLSGAFYKPNFLSYSISPYLNQSRSNSDYQSVSNASGINLNTAFFSGTRFPGSISYSKSYDSEGSYNLPGLPNYVTHGNNSDFGVGWTANFTDLPTLTAIFQRGSSNYDVYGTSQQGQNHFNTFNLSSSYHIDGFSMGAFYGNGWSNAETPEISTQQAAVSSNSHNTSFGYNLNHQLPLLRGSFAASANRSTWDANLAGNSTTGAIDIIQATATARPLAKLSLSTSLSYSDNLTGSLLEYVLSQGGPVTSFNTSQKSDATDFSITAGYVPHAHIATSAYYQHRGQNFYGQSYGVETYGSSVNFNAVGRFGAFSGNLVVAGNTTDGSDGNSLTFSTDENYSSILKGYDFSASFGYGQNVQTLLVTYMNSSYHAGASLRKRWGNLIAAAGGSGSRTALTEQAGDVSSSFGVFGSISYSPKIAVNGNWNRSSGEAIITGAGLVTITNPGLPSDLVSLYGGKSYSVSASTTPIPRWVVTSSWSSSHSNVSADTTSSVNETKNFNFLSQYHFRKLSANCGFTRLEQGFSTSGTVPQTVSSFYIGVSRWFKFF